LSYINRRNAGFVLLIFDWRESIIEKGGGALNEAKTNQVAIGEILSLNVKIVNEAVFWLKLVIRSILSP
jgi:hypothetical protein